MRRHDARPLYAYRRREHGDDDLPEFKTASMRVFDPARTQNDNSDFFACQTAKMFTRGLEMRRLVFA
jgi:hypothetical protein